MIERCTGDLLAADTEGLVNAVNCVGVMGKGLALAFKTAFPENFRIYKAACSAGNVAPGKLLVVETGLSRNPHFIINFPTKRHWRAPSRLEDIRAGLEALPRELRSRQIRSVAVPALGCGLGGLAWPEVEPLIREAFLPLPEIRVLLFSPSDRP